MKCVNDDLGQCCGKCEVQNYGVVAVIPVHGRLPLLKYTIERLYKRNKVQKVICVGETKQEQNLCLSVGAHFVTRANTPLAKKWNAGFMEAKKFNPKACLFVGSSDWVSDNWTDYLISYMDEYDMVGLPGCYLLDIGLNIFRHKTVYRACHWPGYVGPREGESIGIGRMISARILDAMGWQPFDDHLDHSLDYSMVKRVEKKGGKSLLIKTEEIKSLAISTNQWSNKHQFEEHYTNKLPSIKITDPILWVQENFPEAKLIFNDHTVTHQ